MGENQNWNQLGNQIKGALNDALVSGNYNVLNSLVMDTVNSAIDEAKRQTQNAIANSINTQNGYTNYKTKNNYKASDYYIKFNAKPAKNVTPVASYTRINKVGQVSGILYIVFGSIALAVFAILGIVFGSLRAAGFNFSLGLVQTMLGCGILSFGTIIHGSKKLSRLSRAKRYIKLCGQRMYIELETLASHLGKSKKFVAKDIRKMLSLGIFPEGHMDKNETCLMISNEVYRTYMDSEKARMIREEEPKKAQENVTNVSDTQKKLDSLMMDGVDYIYKIRNFNEQIEGEVISEKLTVLENLLKDIFAEVKKNPDKIEQMQRFMEYYLPTTLKLVEAYADFDKVRNPGDDIVQAKVQIENTLDTINAAFNELLNNMFRDKVFDVTTDAQVLQTILSKDGLVQDDFGTDKDKVLLK